IYATLSSPVDAGKKGGHSRVLPGPPDSLLLPERRRAHRSWSRQRETCSIDAFVGKRRHPCRPCNCKKKKKKK
ncbi:unnamed protein product, partial [Musa textilis]